MNFLLRWFCTLTLSGLALASQAEVAVIAHPDAPGTPTRNDIMNIYLGLDRSLTPIDLRTWSDTRTRFYHDLIRKNESQLKSHWATLIFTGKGRPPRAVKDQAAMLEQVANNPQAIGYVDSRLVDDSVRVLFILR